MRPRAIHQFHHGSAYGDGITNGMLFTQKILRGSGYKSDIFCVQIDAKLSGRIRPVRAFENNPTDLLLVHYSLGTDHDPWITSLKSPCILVYHNITPADFFPEGSPFRQLASSGRRQLAQWASKGPFTGAIADSSFNAEELRAFGYASIEPIPLLVDLDWLRRHPWNRQVAGEIDGARNLLFIGRICEHKGQLELVRMMGDLARSANVPVRLLLAGATAVDAYGAKVENEIDKRGLGRNVRVLGARSDNDIFALYRLADLYVSLSAHEGFGMPLVEAMAFDMPVLAAATGSVAATLGVGGLVLEKRAPAQAAAAAKLILEEPWLRQQIIQGQREALARFERPVVVNAFERYLRSLGFEVTFEKQARTAPRGHDLWSVEGPCDSSYSLAIVNRGLARGLAHSGAKIALVSRDGPGSFAPKPSFLAANADLAAMVAQAQEGTCSDVTLRNQYPPYVANIRAALRVLANFAWEESALPAAWVQEFNSCLDLITVTSAFVAKVLRDNGVHTPIQVVGNGIDQVRPQLADGARHPGPFRFLHISSCFPRKGADALLAAWGQAFSSDDGVELVIKTFPNEHNHIEAEIAAFKAHCPHHAPINLINKDIDTDALRELYVSADAIVCPTRGEGFGLPLAEALALAKPVITTAYGGQSDFCNSTTAWLCDYSFAYARSHFEVFDSAWVEPNVASLTATLKGCFAADPLERARRAEAGRSLILGHYRWDCVADRTRQAIETVKRLPGDVLRLPKIGWVSTWNTRCGIADYSQSLVCAIEPERLVVFADRSGDLLRPDANNVLRCWTQGWDDPLTTLYDAISSSDVDAAVIQFNFGFFRLEPLGRLIEKLHARGILVFIVMHSTMDLVRPDVTMRLADIKSALARATRLLVHSVHDLNHLKGIGLISNVALFPMGMPKPYARDFDLVRAELGLGGRAIVASFGYLLPHKGLRELIGAFALIKREQPKAHLLMLNAIYPGPDSEREHRLCRDEIERLGVSEYVTLVSDFMGEAEVLARLGAADVIVYPYQRTQESASAAVKMGLGSLAPVACTPLPIFADVASVSYQLPGSTPKYLANGILALLSDRPLRAELQAKQRAWVSAHDWETVSHRLCGLIRGEARAQHIPKSM